MPPERPVQLARLAMANRSDATAISRQAMAMRQLGMRRMRQPALRAARTPPTPAPRARMASHPPMARMRDQVDTAHRATGR